MKKSNLFVGLATGCAILCAAGCSCLPPGQAPEGWIVEPATPPKALNPRAAVEHDIMLFSSYFLSKGLPGNRVELVVAEGATEEERRLCEDAYFGIVRQAALRRGTECRFKLVNTFEGALEGDRIWRAELFDGEKAVKEQTIHLLK